MFSQEFVKVLKAPKKDRHLMCNTSMQEGFAKKLSFILIRTPKPKNINTESPAQLTN